MSAKTVLVTRTANCLVTSVSSIAVALPEQIRLSLEILVGSTPIEGSVTSGTGDAIRFTGWMQLMPIIEAAREGGLSEASSDSVDTEGRLQ